MSRAGGTAPKVDAKPVLLRERAALVDTLRTLGPDAPTLCEGWTTADLAAHIVTLERNPAAAPGNGIGGPLAAYTRAAIAKEKARGYDAQLDRLAAGPPGWVVRTLAALQVHENWVHHEDARRANGMGPRVPDADTESVLTRVVRKTARYETRAVRGVGLALDLPDEMIVVRYGHPTAVIEGRVGEVALYLNGRRTAADVRIAGKAAAVEALSTAPLGV